MCIFVRIEIERDLENEPRIYGKEMKVKVRKDNHAFLHEKKNLIMQYHYYKGMFMNGGKPFQGMIFSL